MEIIEFKSYNDNFPMAFIVDKIVAFSPSQVEENKTRIFVISAGGENDEFLVSEKYTTVLERLNSL